MDVDFSGTVTASELCGMAGITPVTLRSWKARWKERGLSLIPDAEGWTRYNLADALNIVLVAELTELKLNPVDIGPEIMNLVVFQDDTTFLVISTGKQGHIIPTSPRGGPASRTEECAKVYVPGRWYSDIVRGRDLLAFLQDPDRYQTVVSNLSSVERRVKEAWAALKSR